MKKISKHGKRVLCVCGIIVVLLLGLALVSRPAALADGRTQTQRMPATAGGASGDGRRLKLARGASSQGRFVQYDHLKWVADYCAKPSTEELRKLLADGHLSAQERAGVAWLDRDLVSEALGGIDLDQAASVAVLDLFPDDYPVDQLEELVRSFTPPSSEQVSLLAKRYLKSGDREKATALLKEAISLSKQDSNREIRQSIGSVLNKLGRDPSGAELFSALKSPCPNGMLESAQELSGLPMQPESGYTPPATFTGEDWKVVAEALNQSVSNEYAHPMDRFCSFGTLDALREYSLAHGTGVDEGVKNEVADLYLEAQNSSSSVEGVVQLMGREKQINDFLSGKGEAAEYYKKINDDGLSRAWAWLLEAHPALLQELK